MYVMTQPVHFLDGKESPTQQDILSFFRLLTVSLHILILFSLSDHLLLCSTLNLAWPVFISFFFFLCLSNDFFSVFSVFFCSRTSKFFYSFEIPVNFRPLINSTASQIDFPHTYHHYHHYHLHKKDKSRPSTDNLTLSTPPSLIPTPIHRPHPFSSPRSRCTLQSFTR